MKDNKNGGYLMFLVMIGILVIFSGCIKDSPPSTTPSITTASPTPTLTATPTPTSISTISTPTSTPIATVTPTVTPIQTPAEPILITAPSDKASVPERALVEGTVNNSNFEVWVIIHPMEVSDYWVQPPVTIKKDGTWRGSIYIGRPGTVDVSKQYEIIAVANPKVKLNEGDQLRGWPDAQWKSEVILVTRQ